jgi:hypothetical protein
MLGLPYLLDILKFTLAGLGVVWLAFYLIRPYLDRSENLQMVELKRTISGQTLPLRLQAYERVVLFVDRVNPGNMLIRLNATAYSAAELHNRMVNEIREEYQHNVTQQIYVSARAWAVVKRVKDDTLSIANNVIKGIPADASGLDFSRVLLAHLAQLEDNPYDIALNLIRQDMEGFF